MRPPLHHLPASPVKLSAGYASSGLKIVPFRGALFASASASGEAGGAHRPDVLRSRARPQVVAPPSRRFHRRFRAALTSHHPLSSSSSPLPTPCAPIDSSRRPSFDAAGSGGWEAGAPVQGRVQGGKAAKKADAARVGQRAEVAAVAECHAHPHKIMRRVSPLGRPRASLLRPPRLSRRMGRPPRLRALLLSPKPLNIHNFRSTSSLRRRPLQVLDPHP
ncbi:hypothetical protein B0H11DRAFT_303335 [Mycena galericulata]|nr:hypothetical protein B0H11DRAFT_303335 [Mycena galericulata]